MSNNTLNSLKVFGEIDLDTAARILYRDESQIAHHPAHINTSGFYLWHGWIPDTKTKPGRIGRFWIPNLFAGGYAKSAADKYGVDRLTKSCLGLHTDGISRLCAHFFEFDRQTIEYQLERIAWLEAETGLRPGLLVHSGDTRPESIKAAGVDPADVDPGQSIHAYILLDRALDANKANMARWIKIQRLLVQIFGSDKSIAKPHQLMRRPSSVGRKWGLSAGPCRIQTTLRAEAVYYDEADILAHLEALAGRLGLNAQQNTPKASGTVSRKTGRPQIQIAADTLIETDSGESFRFGDWKPVEKVIVKCPRHEDKTPSAFGRLAPSGKPYVSCSTCAVTYWPESAETPTAEIELAKVLGALGSLPPMPSEQDDRKGIPDEQQIARAMKAWAYARVPLFRNHLDEIGFPKSAKPCRFTQGAESTQSQQISLLQRGCNKLSCSHCAPRLLSVKAAAIACSLRQCAEIHMYHMPSDQTDAWIRRFQRACERIDVNESYKESYTTQVRRFEGTPAYVAFWGPTHTIILANIRPETFSRKHSEGPRKTLTDEHEIVDWTVGLMLYTYRLGVSEIEDLVSGETREFYHLAGKVTSSQNLDLDPDQVLHNAARKDWEVIVNRAVSPSEGAEIWRYHGQEVSEDLATGKKKLLSTATTGAIPDPAIREFLLNAVTLNAPNPIQYRPADPAITAQIDQIIASLD